MERSGIDFVVCNNAPSPINIIDLYITLIGNMEGDLLILIKPYVRLRASEGGAVQLDRDAVSIVAVPTNKHSDGYLSGNYTGPGSQMTLFIGSRRPR